MERKINRLLITALVLAALFGGAAYLVKDQPHASEAGGEFTFPLLEYIDIDLRQLDVSLIPYDGGEIIIGYKSDRPLEMKTGDNKLMISESTAFVVSLFAGKQNEFGVKVYLPRTTYRDITVYTGAGNITIGKIDSKMLSASTEVGNIRAESMTFKGSFSTVEGDIYANMDVVASGTEIFNRRGDTELIFPPNSSVAVDFSTNDGKCLTELTHGQEQGSYLYAWRGGAKEITVDMDHGTLTLKERAAQE